MIQSDHQSSSSRWTSSRTSLTLRCSLFACLSYWWWCHATVTRKKFAALQFMHKSSVSANDTYRSKNTIPFIPILLASIHQIGYFFGDCRHSHSESKRTKNTVSCQITFCLQAVALRLKFHHTAFRLASSTYNRYNFGHWPERLRQWQSRRAYRALSYSRSANTSKKSARCAMLVVF